MPTTDGRTVLDDDAVAPRVSWLDTQLTRFGVTSVLARDGVLTAFVVLMTGVMLVVLFEFALGREDLALSPAPGTVLVVAACVQGLPLVLRRVRPVLAFALVVVCQVVIIATSPADLSVGGVPQLVVGYTIGTVLPVRRALLVTSAAVPVVVLAAGATALLRGSDLLMPVTNHFFSAILTYLVSALVGGAVATRRQYVELLRLRATEAVRTEQARTQAAIVAERSRMARELHDVAAHHLSGLVVQAAAVERQIDSDPVTAKQGTAWIRAQGKETLDSLRLIVGVLRERQGTGGHEDDGYDAPPPGLGALDGLVRTARTLGARVDLTRSGRPRALAPIADAAFYRVAQESLSNARQHAHGAPVRIAVDFAEREVSLGVVNARAVGGTPVDSRRQGMGLIGMRERAQLVGATLTTGPTSAGGWQVRLTLPVHREPHDATAGAETAEAEGGQR